MILRGRVAETMAAGPDLPFRELARIDPNQDSAGLPPSLVSEMESVGGLWAAGDAYTSASAVVRAAQRNGIVALRLDFRDLELLRDLPGIRYLHIRSDGRPRLEPVAALTQLKALILRTGALRGELNPLGFPELRWLRIGLGGKGGVGAVQAVREGHPALRWLSVREVKASVVTNLCAAFPELRVLRIGYADHLKSLGAIDEAMPNLEKIAFELTQIESIEELAGLHRLVAVEIFGGRTTDLTPLRALNHLRYARLELPRLETIEPLRGHAALRMIHLAMAREPDIAVLASMPKLAAVGRGNRFEQRTSWPDLKELSSDHPLRAEWDRVMRE
jgi:hypothetical protein